MATNEFKHIRTSVLPCGYVKKEEGGEMKGFYKFSLCIDLNPNEPNGEHFAYTPGFEKLIKEYSLFYSKLLNVIPKINVFDIKDENGKIIEEPIKVVSYRNSSFDIKKYVDEIWAIFLKGELNKKNNTSLEREPKLDISTDATLFNSKEIPNTENLHKAAISSFYNIRSGKSATRTINALNKEIQEISDKINSFSSQIKGISDFSEMQNFSEFDRMQKNVFDRISTRLSLNTLDSVLETGSIFDSLDSMLETWSFIDSNSILQRLFGKTIDFEIDEKFIHEHFESINEIKISNIKDFEEELKYFTSYKIKSEFGEQRAFLSWEHLPTPIKIYEADKQKIILIDEYAKVIKNDENKDISRPKLIFTATNHDVGGKLIGLKSIIEKFNDLYSKINDPKVPESEKYKLRKELILLDTNSLTIGVNSYNDNLSEVLKYEELVEKQLEKETGPLKNYLYRITRGYRFAAINKNNVKNISPIGARKVSIKLFDGATKKYTTINFPSDFDFEKQVAISTNNGTHALLLDQQGNLVPKVLQDEALLNWSGENIGLPSVFANYEDDENFESQVTEGSVSNSTLYLSNKIQRFYKEDYKLNVIKYTKARGDKTLSTEGIEVGANTPVVLELSYNKNKKLLFGHEYDIILTPEYKNGWAVPFDVLIKIQKETFHFLNVSKFTFKRNEPVKPIEFILQEPLTQNDKKTPIKLREGESIDKLVIRNLSNVDDDKIYTTQQTSIRHILPPAISFQHAFWHNKIFEMSTNESYKWYMKHHFPVEEKKDFMRLNSKGEWVKESTGKDKEGKPIYRKYTFEEAVNGSTIMRPYYPDECQINYLPDPLSIGFRFEFFKDKNRLIKAKNYEKYEQLEFYFTGKYPKINAWKIILEDYNLNENELLLVNTKKEEITIRLEKGDELFVSARTILSEDYEKQFETYGNYNDFTRYGNNDLLTPPLEFSLVHATQRPLVRPKLNNILNIDKEQDKTFLEITATANIEQTGIYLDNAEIVRYLEENMPTGNIEIYAKWEEYKDDPKHVTTDKDNWTPNKPINSIDKLHFKHTDNETPATFETAIEVSKQLDKMEATLNKIASNKNDFKNYAVDLQLSYDVRETKFIEKYFWIKNKSKFTSYYPKDWGTIDEDTSNEEEQKLLKKDFHYSKEIFNRLSSNTFLIRILNSKKPNAPVVSDKNITLVSVIEDRTSNKTVHRKASMNRLRFFFERGRLTSGKGERIGFVVNEPQAIYNDYLIKNNLVSIVGRDIVSDTLKPYDGLFRNEEVLLTKANFVINDPYDLKDFKTNTKSDDLESFSPKYIKELGLMTYLPKFDKKLNLWYLDVEMDINDDRGRELHSPFMRFSIVHYQENSFNYNANKETDISKDCRLSGINKSGYVYILPTRNIKLQYGSKYMDGVKRGFVEVELTYNESSIKIDSSSNNSSKFYLVIRHRLQSESKWIVSDKAKKGDSSAFFKLDKKVAELDFIFYKKDTDYQIVILETEDWGNENDTSFDKLFENKNSRVVHVNTFEIDNNEL